MFNFAFSPVHPPPLVLGASKVYPPPCAWCIGASSTDCKKSVTTGVAFCPSRLVQAVSQVLLKVSQVLHIFRLFFVQPILLFVLMSGAPFPLSYPLLASCASCKYNCTCGCCARLLINAFCFLRLVQKHLHALQCVQWCSTKSC